MVVADYITSGILEQYVAGTATPQERQEVECMSHIYPEIKAELDQLQAALEAYAQTYAVKPPAGLKAKIFDAIDQADVEPVAYITPVAVAKPASKVVEMPARRINYWAAASVAALVATSAAFWFTNETKNTALADQKKQIDILKIEREQADAILANREKDIRIMSDASNQVVVLKGVPGKVLDATMRVYWNPKSQEVYVGQLDLPAAPADKQYQLWALANGVPVDMGVFDLTQGELTKMKSAVAAQAFAVTLEPKGGSVSPTLSEMYVLGTI
jgi:Anti-sigma-K factor rskA